MNELQLSKRLETVADNVPKDGRVADLGSDHAYLPCYLALKKQVAFAIAGELNDGPFQSAKQQVEKLSLEHIISVRKGNGLEVVEQGEVDVITIAGMGGGLIASILEEGKEKLTGVKRLVLQPNVSADKVRRWLIDHDWELVGEHILEEDAKVYEVLVADKGDGYRPYQNKDKEAAILLGPYLMDEKNEAFLKKWTSEKRNWQRILGQLPVGTDTENKKRELERLIQIVREAIA